MIGVLGQVHPVTAKAYDIPETYVAELNLSIEALFNQPQPLVEIITKFLCREPIALPQSRSDPPQLVDAIQAAGVKRLTDIKLFDVFW